MSGNGRTRDILHAEVLDGGSLAPGLKDSFIEGHSADQILDSFVDVEVWVAVRVAIEEGIEDEEGRARKGKSTRPGVLTGSRRRVVRERRRSRTGRWRISSYRVAVG